MSLEDRSSERYRSDRSYMSDKVDKVEGADRAKIFESNYRG